MFLWKYIELRNTFNSFHKCNYFLPWEKVNQSTEVLKAGFAMFSSTGYVLFFYKVLMNISRT